MFRLCQMNYYHTIDHVVSVSCADIDIENRCPSKHGSTESYRNVIPNIHKKKHLF